MASVVLGLGASHAPQINIPPAMWAIHGEGDKTETTDMFLPDMRAVSYEEALAQADTSLANEVNLETWQARWDSCQNGVASVRQALVDADPDVLVMFAADLSALFLDDDMASASVYTDDTIVNVPRPMTPDTPPSNVASAWAHGWGEGAVDKPYPVASDLAEHLLEQLTSENFDVIRANYLAGKSGMGVQMAFAYNRIMGNKVIPTIPVFQSPFVSRSNAAPRPSYSLGQAVRGAIESAASDARVAVLGIGGLSHFIVNEELDRSIIQAMQEHNGEFLSSVVLPLDRREPGSTSRHRRPGMTSQTRNWFATAGASGDLQMELIDYIPCYRTPAGTGCGVCFAKWT